jgi:hypothetical protein
VARNKKSVILKTVATWVAYPNILDAHGLWCGAREFCLEASLTGLGQPAVHSAQDLAAEERAHALAPVRSASTRALGREIS